MTTAVIYFWKKVRMRINTIQNYLNEYLYYK